METEHFVFSTLSTYPRNLELRFFFFFLLLFCEEVEIREIVVPWDNWVPVNDK